MPCKRYKTNLDSNNSINFRFDGSLDEDILNDHLKLEQEEEIFDSNDEERGQPKQCKMEEYTENQKYQQEQGSNQRCFKQYYDPQKRLAHTIGEFKLFSEDQPIIQPTLLHDSHSLKKQNDHQRQSHLDASSGQDNQSEYLEDKSILEISKRNLQKIQKTLKLGKLKVGEIAQIFSLPLEVIERLSKRYKKYGGICNNQRSNLQLEQGFEKMRPPKLTKNMEILIDLLKGNPNMRQLDIQQAIEKKYHIDLSQASISRYIQSINLMFKRVTRLKQTHLAFPHPRQQESIRQEQCPKNSSP